MCPHLIHRPKAWGVCQGCVIRKALPYLYECNSLIINGNFYIFVKVIFSLSCFSLAKMKSCQKEIMLVLARTRSFRKEFKTLKIKMKVIIVTYYLHLSFLNAIS